MRIKVELASVIIVAVTFFCGACSGQQVGGSNSVAATKTAPAADVEQLTNEVLVANDKNGDGCLSDSEYMWGAIRSFEALDQSNNGSLCTSELGNRFNKQAQQADNNNDQEISFAEALRSADREFQKCDSNRDGRLDQQELKVCVSKKLQEK